MGGKITVRDVGLVQGLLVVAQQLKKYAKDGFDTNGARPLGDPRANHDSRNNLSRQNLADPILDVVERAS